MADNYQINRTVDILKTQPDSVNPATDINFQLILPNCPGVQYFCQRVNLPGLTIPVAYQSTPTLSIPNPGTGIKFNNLSISFKVDVTYGNYMEIQNWIRRISEPLGAKSSNYPQNNNLFADINLRIMNNFNNENTNFTFWRAFPVSLSSIELKSDDPSITYIEATSEFSFSYYEQT